VVEAATKAASGSNSQPVRWIVVTDPGESDGWARSTAAAASS